MLKRERPTGIVPHNMGIDKEMVKTAFKHGQIFPDRQGFGTKAPGILPMPQN